MGVNISTKHIMDTQYTNQEKEVGVLGIVFMMLFLFVGLLGCVFCCKLCKIAWSPKQERRHVTVVNKCCCEGKCRKEETAVELGSNKTEQDPEAPPAYEEVVL